MQVQRHPSARAYLDTAGAWLRREPVVNQLAIAIATTCEREPERYGPGVLFFSAEDHGEICGAALQTPPWPVQVSRATAEAARALADAFAALPDELGGVGGPDDAPAAFAAAYAHARGRSVELVDSLGTFELTAVEPIAAAPGRRVIAGAEHEPVIQRWLMAFQAEATPHDPPASPGAGARAVATGRAHVWLDEDGEPVAYAFNNREVEGWASVGPVYTPPDRRGRGYATSLVASLSQCLLDQGRPGCTLYTNLANPTSNAIYERIGYRRVGSAFRYAFGAPVARPPLDR